MKPLLPAESIPPKFTAWAATVMKLTSISDMEVIRKMYDQEFLRGETFMNDLYVVIRTALPGDTFHLSIRRTDRGHAKDWRHFQQIKNQLCGKEREAVELYPAESRLIDTANQFHLWVFPAGFRVPVGYNPPGPCVTGPDIATGLGAVQRAFESET